jgi:hypothetical protein
MLVPGGMIYVHWECRHRWEAKTAELESAMNEVRELYLAESRKMSACRKALKTLKRTKHDDHEALVTLKKELEQLRTSRGS